MLEPAAPRAAAQLQRAFARAGLPDGLLELGATSGLEHVVTLDPPRAKGTMLLLEGAPLDRAVTGALWAAFAGGGRRPAAVGRAIAPRARALALAAGVEAAARRLRVGDPRDPETEVGPLANAEDAARVEALVAAAERDGATRLCGGPVAVLGAAGAFYAPVVLRGVPPGAALLTEPVPGPVLAVVEAAGEAEAIALAAGEAGGADGSSGGPAGALSVWAGDPARGERVARALGAPIAWVNEHGVASPAAPVRLARYVQPCQIASQPTRLRSARWLPYDPALVRAATATAQLVHGREADRWPALSANAGPLARTAARLAREALGR